MRPPLDDLTRGLDPLLKGISVCCHIRSAWKGGSGRTGSLVYLRNESEDHGLRIDAEYSEYFKNGKKGASKSGFLDQTLFMGFIDLVKENGVLLFSLST